MTQKTIAQSLTLRGYTIRNRLCVPPLVAFRYNKDPQGFVSDENVEHYRAMAKGGMGLIVQEATCVSPEGRLDANQLGLWDDAFIPGLKRVADAAHENGAKIVVQIHHAGTTAETDELIAPSPYCFTEEYHDGTTRVKQSRAMTQADIDRVQRAFVDAALRCVKAGYDGVELHGCHGYLLSQFFNSRVNHRDDAYGQDKTLFARQIIRAIRKEVPEDFIVGIRIGVFEPTFEQGMQNILRVAQEDVDFLNVSYGFGREMDPTKPDGFPYSAAVYGAGEVKKAVGSKAVFAVDGIRTAQDAQGVLDLTDVDMLCIGRCNLVDPQWANKVLAGQEPGICLHCKSCNWMNRDKACAGQVLLERRGK